MMDIETRAYIKVMMVEAIARGDNILADKCLQLLQKKQHTDKLKEN